MDKIKEIEKTLDREKLVYKIKKYACTFENFQTIKTFGEDIYNGTITLKEANDYQTNLLKEIVNFNEKTRQKVIKKNKKKIILKNLRNFSEGREKVLNPCASKIFLIESKGSGLLNTNRSKLKILKPKQMLQRLPMALAQVKAGNNSENLVDEIRQIVYSLYQ